jgi:MoaA/NifB/PqqE/SkfB family radical SAM enzyme
MITCPLPNYVELETARLCNRTCTWCPNGHTDARRVQELMPWSGYVSLLRQLAEREYKGLISLHNYNEPLLNPRLYEEMAEILRLVPGARPGIFTNGDFLDADKVRRLVAEGANYLRVTLYPRDLTPRPQDDRIRLQRWLDRRLAGLDVHWAFGAVHQGFGARAFFGSCKLVVIVPAIMETYNNRGGTVRILPLVMPRRVPCGRTLKNIAIDYKGSLKMCCNVYPESPDHERYVIGNVFDSGLWELWCSPKMDALRRAHQVADWSLSPICRSCKHMEHSL